MGAEGVHLALQVRRYEVSSEGACALGFMLTVVVHAQGFQDSFGLMFFSQMQAQGRQSAEDPEEASLRAHE